MTLVYKLVLRLIWKEKKSQNIGVLMVVGSIPT